jgi:hypothetical protein
MKTLTQTSATDGQIKQLTRAGQDAVEKAIKDFGLDKDGAQRVHGNPDFAARINEATTTILKDLSVSDKYKSEEVKSNYGYLSGYKPKGLTEQCNRLRKLFPGLGFANLDLLAQIESGKADLPKMSKEDGWAWFAIPNIWKPCRLAAFGTTYSEALLKVLDTIKQTRNGNFVNYREGQIDEKHLRQSVRTQRFWKELSEAQGNPDILIVYAQFGIRHRGRSVRRAIEVFLGNEFGLGAFAVGIMLLTHPERLMNYDDLWIDCAGDEFDDPDSDVRFGRSPCLRFLFLFGDDEVEFSARYVGGASDDYGSASGLAPQQ